VHCFRFVFNQYSITKPIQFVPFRYLNYMGQSRFKCSFPNLPNPSMSFSPNSKIGCKVAKANVPDLEKSYECFPLWFVVCFAVSQFGAFLGCFFGTRGPEDQWPVAWWALGMIPWWAPFVFHAKIVRTPDKIKFVSYLFGEQESIKLEDIEELELAKNCCGVYIRARFTEDAVKRKEREAGACKCCISRSESISFFSGKVLQEFCLDHGFGKETLESA